MPQTMMVRLSETIASGRLKLAAFRYWLTKNKRWREQDPTGVLCTSFCPCCKYYEACNYELEMMEASDD